MLHIELQRNGGIAPGYLAVPASEWGRAVIVLQDSDPDGDIRSICDRLAGEGLFALAPDLRRGETTVQPVDAEGQTMALSMQAAEQDMLSAVQHLLSTPGVQGPSVGALGFGFGGGMALRAAAVCPEIAPMVVYYCTLPGGRPDFSRIAGPVLGHFGTADVFISLRDAKALELDIRAAGIEVEFDKYTGAAHAFFNDTGRLGAYDPSAAERSWERSVSFLQAALARSGMTHRSDSRLAHQFT
ncbi:MAG TPA: dienelactone hydrolase family protein [Solirubrobacteraceae bacterium]|nr:dienelactone hydrolase family protein [Solirubrobacteraceae bacterium]